MICTISYTLVVVPTTTRSIISLIKGEKTVKKQSVKSDDGVFETKSFKEEEKLESDDLPYRRTKVESWLKKEIDSLEKNRKIHGETVETKNSDEKVLSEEESRSIEEEIPETKKHETEIKDIFPDEESFDFEDKKYDDIVDVKDLDRPVKPKMLFGKPLEKSNEPMFWDKPSEGKPQTEEKIQKTKDTPHPVEKSESFEKPVPKPIIEEKKVEEKTVVKEEEIVSPVIEKEDASIEEKKPEKEIPVKSKINVRCPGCKNIFAVEIIDGKIISKIKCPHCGREGVAK
jgi:ribosomal protein S27E/ubiquitin